ncbi:hypothetical protein [Ureibacillus acetophenoni]|uniref:Uncharacterized protein n=1 Tax=Ureibacillus acetophenoni TaxID=614649 RepID=A0A285UDF4_9BACL|nr:hypothetical protein [Ureibacillus acetophenoni]SOC39862.1 hypothetical protein SAMN05877842_106158 [Ureibacillus acetophenoni]
MLVHHSGNKSKEFFYSYMRLILLTRTSSIDEMQKIVESYFFNGNIEEYGEHTREQYIQALKQIQSENDK